MAALKTPSGGGAAPGKMLKSVSNKNNEGSKPTRGAFLLLTFNKNKLLQWKPVKVTPLKVNIRFTSTADIGPVFLLFISVT